MQPKNKPFLSGLAIFMSGLIIFSCSNEESSDVYRTVDTLPFSDTLRAERVISMESEELFLSMPVQMFVVADSFLVIAEMTSENFIHVFSLPDVSYLYSWGINGQGPEEFQFPTMNYFTDGNNRFSVYDYALGQIRFFQMEESGIKLAGEAVSMRYTGQFNYLDKLTKSSDSLYVANLDETPMKDPEVEHIGLQPNNETPVLYFGEYPESELKGGEKYFRFRKSLAAKPNGELFAAFYAQFNRFKVYDSSGALVKDVQIVDKGVRIKPSPDSYEQDAFIFRHVFGAPSNERIYTLGHHQTGSEWEQQESLTFPFLEAWNWNGGQTHRAYFDRKVQSVGTVSEKEGKLYVIDFSFKNILVYDISHLSGG